MNSYKIMGTFALVLLMTVAVLGAASNNSTHTSGTGSKKPASLARSGSSNSTKTTTIRVSRGGESSSDGSSGSHSAPATKGSQQVFGQRIVNSTRVTRGAPSDSPASKGSPVLGVRKANSTRVARAGTSTPAPPKGSSVSGGKKSNSTRVVREADETEVVEGSSDSQDQGVKSSSNNKHIPSTHPLFANRQTSNITNSLRPKLRTHPAAPGKVSESSEVDSKEKASSGSLDLDTPDSSDADSHVAVAPSHKRKSSTADSDEQTVSVVSTGPVAVHSRNSSRPALRGPGSRRASSTQAPAHDEEIEVFVI